MAKRNSVSDRQKKVVRPVDTVLFSQDKQENTQSSKHTNIQTKQQVNALKRQTYYLSEEIIQALKTHSYYTDKDKSQIVREALEAFIPKEHFERK